MKNFFGHLKRDPLRQQGDGSQTLAEKFTKCVIESQLVYIETDAEMAITEWNPSAEKLFGYSAQAAKGQHLLTLLFPPDRQTSIRRAIAKAIDFPTEHSQRTTARNITKDGKNLICRWQIIPLSGPSDQVTVFVFHATDITESLNDRISAQLNLKILSAIPDPIWYKDIHGVYRLCNDQFAESVGMDKSEIVGKTSEDVFPPEIAAQVRRNDQVVLQSQSPMYGEDGARLFQNGEFKETVRLPIRHADGSMAGIVGIARNLSDQFAVRSAVSQEKHNLAQLLEAAPLAYISTDLNGMVLESNQYARDGLGFVPQSSVNQRFLNVDERTLLMADIRNNGNALNHTLSIYAANGQVRRFLVNVISTEDTSGTPIFTYWALDVEELKRARDDLRQVTDNLEQILNSLPIPVALGNLDDMRLSYCNPAFVQCLGLKTSGELIGKTFQEISPSEQVDQNVMAVEQATQSLQDPTLTQKVVEFDWTFQRTDGTPVPTHVMAGRVVHRNRRSFAANIRDMTQELARQKLLEEAAQTAADANRLKGSFLANMSHEIRTPMNAIIGLSRVEMERETDVRQAASFRKIHESARLLLSIINDILDFSKIEAGKLTLESVEFDLNQIIGEAMQVATAHLAGKQAEILYLPAPHLPSMYVGDPTRVWQILKNILDNAARFTEKGEIVLSTRPLPDADPSSDIVRLEFTIRDTGIGMSQAQMDRIFKPFEQADGSTTRRYGGTGLGLSITHTLLNLMHGTISVSSVVGTGSTFTIQLPLKRAHKDVVMPTFTDLNVLVVDDNPTARESLSSMLQSMGISVQTVSSGQDALTLLQSSDDVKNRFNLIFLDFMMDGMNGLELAAAIERARLSYSPRLLMVTAYARELLHEQLETTHILDVLEKPVNPRSLAEKIQQVLHGTTVEVKPKRKTYNGKRLLIAEDNPFNQDVALAMLEPYGLAITIVDNGQQAVEKATTEEFDLILMDIQMPQKDGLTATREIRASGISWAQTVPIVAMTAHALKDDEAKSLDAGMNGHISKPIVLEVLDGILSRYLQSEVSETVAPVETPSTEKILPFPAFRFIDISDGLSRFSGDTDVYTRLLLNFYRHNTKTISELEGALEASDHTLFRRLIHTLKGTAGSVGAKNLMHTAATVETGIGSTGIGDLATYRLAISRIASALNPVLDELKHFVERHEQESAVHYDTSRPLDTVQLDSRLREMKAFLLASDMKAADTFQEMIAMDGVGVWGEKLDEIAEKLEQFDFPAILPLIDELQKENGVTE